MAEMGRYCKAYHAKRFREFEGWKENLSDLRKEKKLENGKEIEADRRSIEDDDILYLQENYVVTDGVFKDQNIVFDGVTNEWKEFCRKVLEFEIPT